MFQKQKLQEVVVASIANTTENGNMEKKGWECKERGRENSLCATENRVYREVWGGEGGDIKKNRLKTQN